MKRGYSHIVIGAGAIGSATAHHLAAKGAQSVLVIEQFDLVNTLGSSGDHSRIIRHSYHSTAYTALTPAMFESWAELERESGLALLTTTGGLDLAQLGTSGHDGVLQYKASMDAFGIPNETIDAAQIREAYPQWNIDDDVVALFQKDAGVLDIRRTVSAHTSLALANGVQFLPRTRVEGVSLHEGSVTVHTSEGDFSADNLVVCAASWLGELMPDLGLNYRLTLSQEQVGYFASKNLADFTPDRFPIWVYHSEEPYYGFPVYGEAGVKLARDMRGHLIESDERVFEGDEPEMQILGEFLRRYLPAAAGPALLGRTCVYDMPADREFVLDTLPGHPNVAVFNGAGHAGKFASLMGKILAELTLDGATAHPIEAFSLSRPAITDPDFVPVFRLT